MHTVGLIVEYNPFHNGHKWHLNMAKRATNCSYSIGVMSGNFLQRGEPSILDKWQRTAMAIQGGVDLLIELPVPFAVRSAQYFATGAIRLLSSLGVVSHVCFGSECDNIQLLQTIAETIDTPKLQTMLKETLQKGVSYANALGSALYREHQIAEKMVSTPNNILALEYIRAIQKYAPEIEPVSIKRKDSAYHDTVIQTPFASATAIRHAIFKNQFDKLQQTLPFDSLKIIEQSISSGLGPVSWVPFSNIILNRLRVCQPDFLKQIPGVSEGLEHKLIESALFATNFDDLLHLVKSKRYTYTRIQRLLVHILLELTTDHIKIFDETGPLYARILGFNTRGRKLLKEISKASKIPLITKPSKYITTSSRFKKDLTPLQQMLLLDTKSTDIYYTGVPGVNWRKGGWDFYTSPVFIK